MVVDVNKTYASNFGYTAHGAVSSMKLGNNLWEHTNFNSRLQPSQIGLGTTSTGTASTSVLGLDYTFGVKVSGTLDATKNNGNVESQTITAPNGSGGTVSIVQTYTYDQANRLLSAGEGVAWTQNYGYDIFGNRWVSGYVPNTTLIPTASNHISATNNRLVMGLSRYDDSGNLDRDAAGSTFTYDGENRQVTATVNGQPAFQGHHKLGNSGPQGSRLEFVDI